MRVLPALLLLAPCAPAAGSAQAPPPPAEPAEFELTGALPAEALGPPLADPREPQFAAAVQLYPGDDRFNIVGAANFGATLSLYGWDAPGGGIWQVGVQAGVFSIFDLEAESMDLINADYLVGIPLTARYGPLSARARLLHVSSHLGDEFVLGGRVDERVNLSYEAVDLLLAFEVARTARLYGGGGTLVRTDPGRPPPALRPGRRRGDSRPIPWRAGCCSPSRRSTSRPTTRRAGTRACRCGPGSRSRASC